MSDVTKILQSIEQGDPRAAGELLPLVYDELRKLAAHKLAQERPGQTLQATALVHEAYVRLVGSDVARSASDGTEQPVACAPGPDRAFANRGHFFAAAAEAMRRILVDNARRKGSVKHGGNLVRHELDETCAILPEPREDLLALDEALDKLAVKDTVKAELVKLRYFAGLTNEQAAQALGISTTTADRYWAYAKAWLHQEISREGA
jgi:RNA polymerase sigma factor (sigma-70 family)